MSEYKVYKRRGEIEARPWTDADERAYVANGLKLPPISVSLADERGKREGGYVARNSDNHNDQWFIAPEHFAKHYGSDQHSDDVAVDKFAAAMKAKLAKKRDQGYGGWDDPQECTVTQLAEMLVQHALKGDPIDVGNFAMMLWNRGCEVELLHTAKRFFESPTLSTELAALRVEVEKAIVRLDDWQFPNSKPIVEDIADDLRAALSRAK